MQIQIWLYLFFCLFNSIFSNAEPPPPSYSVDMLAQSKAWGQAGLQGTGENANMVVKKELVQQLGTEEKPSVQSPGDPMVFNRTSHFALFFLFTSIEKCLCRLI